MMERKKQKPKSKVDKINPLDDTVAEETQIEFEDHGYAILIEKESGFPILYAFNLKDGTFSEVKKDFDLYSILAFLLNGFRTVE